MFTVESVRNNLQWLYREGVQAAGCDETLVEAMLRTIDYWRLAQALRAEARIVRDCEVHSDCPGAMNDMGKDLFGERAVRLYDDAPDGDWCGGFSCYELWMQERGMLVTTRCVSVRARLVCGAEIITEFRRTEKYPWQSELDLRLEVLTARLLAMCVPVRLGLVPLYDS
ncbi:MAG: hypothetical protein IJT94_15455 [Oscillibacter sp.]|nr:hypothetical protein [Oscillibacter sp.]